MKVLLNECIPERMRGFLEGHEIHMTAAVAGCPGTIAAGEFIELEYSATS